jgi:hypothetical protein
VGGYWTSLIPMSQAYGYWFAPHAIENQHGWDDPTLDHLDQEGTTSATPSNYWMAMQRRIVSQRDAVPVFSSDAFWYATKDIGGIAFNEVSSQPYPTEWYVR